MMIFELQPDDDPAAIEQLGTVEAFVPADESKTVTLRDKVTGDELVVDADLENIILIFKQVGYQVVEKGCADGAS